MFSITARNVNTALYRAAQLMEREGKRSSSRNGEVLRLPGPLITELRKPNERVLFSGVRNANPVFHLLESLWMLAGRDDVKFVETFVKRMRGFSDDGLSLHGAYGYRWRKWFGYDQLEMIIGELKVNPTSRRCVLQMWTAGEYDDMVSGGDLSLAIRGGKDVPCNTSIYFNVRDGRLSMTVTNRSNDIIWGLYGANAVHMSMLHEYMALAIGLPLGTMVTLSNDAHLYLDAYPMEKLKIIGRDALITNEYEDTSLIPMPLIREGESIEEFDADLAQFFERFDEFGIDAVVTEGYLTDFFQFTVSPMAHAWTQRKSPDRAQRLADKIASPDWAMATRNWIKENFK
jgi:thymidylate synthase